jgi:hypothetical protein
VERLTMFVIINSVGTFRYGYMFDFI